MIENDEINNKKDLQENKPTKKELNKIYRDTHKDYFKKYVSENKPHIKELKYIFYEKIKNK